MPRPPTFTIPPVAVPHDKDCSPVELALVAQHDVSFLCHEWNPNKIAFEAAYHVRFHRSGCYWINTDLYAADVMDERACARGEIVFFEAHFVPNVARRHTDIECRGRVITRTRELTALICNSVRPYITVSNDALWLAIDTIRATQRWVTSELEQSLLGLPTDVVAIVASYYTVTQPCSFYS